MKPATPTFTAIIKNGRPVWDNPDQLTEFLKEYEDIGVSVTIKRRFKPRSTNQNALYWQWMAIMGKDLGYNKETMHAVFKRLHLANKMPILSRDEFMEFLQSESKQIESTQKLSTAEMKEYMDKVDLQAKEIDILLPIPEDKPENKEVECQQEY